MLTLLACGSNGSGQLAVGHAEDISTFASCQFDTICPADGEVIDVVSAASHSLLLLRHAGGVVLLGAGTNTHSQLGRQCALSEETAKTSFRPITLARDAGLADWEPVKIAATWTTSFVVFEREGRQKVVAAGSNDFGELGTGVSGKPGIQVLDIGLRDGEHVEFIRGGQRHVLAVVRGAGGQRVIGWGAARRGELDPTCVGAAPTKKGKQAARAAILPPTEIKVDLSAPIVEIALGAAHTLVLLENGQVHVWGNDLKGQISNLNDVPPNVKGISATWGGSYLLTDRILSQGSNTHGQLLRQADKPTLGLVSLPATPTSIIAGTEHVLVVAKEGQRTGLWSGGWNEHGNLGLGDNVDRAELVKIDISGSVHRVWAGCAASWVLLDSGSHDA